MGLIYISINLYNGKRYIGQTCQKFEHRKQKHIDDAFNRNSDLYFHRALRKSGLDNFVWNVLERNINTDELDKKEMYYIEKYNTFDKDNGYNLTKGGKSSHLSVLNEKQVREIKQLLKNIDISLYDIANKFNIGYSSISDINNGDTWFNNTTSYPIRSSMYDRKLTKEDVFNIYDMLRDGLAFKDIGIIFGCSTTNISNINYGKVNKYLDNNQYPICSKKFSHLSQEEVDKVVELLLVTNMTQNEIADSIGINRKVISNINMGKHKKVKGIKEFPIRKQIV